MIYLDFLCHYIEATITEFSQYNWFSKIYFNTFLDAMKEFSK